MKMATHETIMINGDRVFGGQTLINPEKAVSLRFALKNLGGIDSPIVNVVAATR